MDLSPAKQRWFMGRLGVRGWRSPPTRYQSRSRSNSPARSYRELSEDPNNPGNNLYVTGLSVRVDEKDLKEHFSREGKVLECRLVVDPRTRESRGFAFVTMAHLKDAERCVKYLHRSTLQGRVITVEKAKRKRARTPTPGQYLGVRSIRSSRDTAYSRDYDRRGGRGDFDDRRRRNSRGDYDERRGGTSRGDYDDRSGGSSRRLPKYSPRYSPYRGRPKSPYRGGRRDRSNSDPRSPHRSSDQTPQRNSFRSRSYSRSVTPYYNRDRH